MVGLRQHPYLFASIVISIMLSLGHAESNSLEMHETENYDHYRRRTNLRQREQTHNNSITDGERQEVSPPLSDCLYSASSSEECAKKEGCVWCKEPVYGLCLTEELAEKMSFLPFLTCSNATLAIADLE
mmetsp:Transcript_8524/g.13289  ORF Transcript_8524/g.13289 Transcript_8524/m.13289 type:complete len:129 (+) Transcript_8524:98-484(+)